MFICVSILYIGEWCLELVYNKTLKTINYTVYMMCVTNFLSTYLCLSWFLSGFVSVHLCVAV